MTAAEARSRCAGLEVLPWDEVAVARELTQATAAFLDASPQVAPAAGAPGTWWVGAHGFDGLGGERALAYALFRLARRWHPRARVAIADSCVAARAATWDTDRVAPVHVIPRGGCVAYLAPAPLALVPMDEELRETLRALGLRTVGALAALSAEDVERRWGTTGLAAWRLAHGDDPRRPVLARVEAPRSAGAELGTPAETMEPVLFLVRAALERLVAELVRDGRAAAAVALTLTLDGPTSVLPSGGTPHTVTREVRPARPLARLAPLFERCRAVLDGWTLTAPVSAVSVAIVATAPLSGEQGDLLAAEWRDPAAGDAALARLRAELGPNVVVRPSAREEHRVDNAGAWTDVEEGLRTADRGSPGAPWVAPSPTRYAVRSTHRRDSLDARLTLRLLESPAPVTVDWAPGTAGIPGAVHWRGRRIGIDHALGPERLSGDWWKDGYGRDYWRCESEEGYLLLYRDGSGSGQWYLHGWYD